MPIYEYKCNSCGTLFEKLQKFSDPPTAECENCHSADVARVLSPPAFHLKGGGWYKDGYAASGSSSKSESGSSESKSSDSNGSKASTESKPAAKPDSTTTASKPTVTAPSDKK